MVMIYSNEDEDSDCQSYAPTSIQMTEMRSDSGSQQKIALLQKSLEEKDQLISELRSENDLLKVRDVYMSQWHYSIIQNASFSMQQSQENALKKSDHHEHSNTYN